MGIIDDLLGNTSADAANAAAADTYRKQLAASSGLRAAGAQAQGDFQSASNRYSPYTQAGGAALDQLMAGLGLGGPVSQGQFTDAYRSLPGYQAGLDTGTTAAIRGANAGGMLNSGRALKALQRFGSDYEDQRVGSYLDRLTGLQSQGLGATGQQVGTIGQGINANLGARQSAFGNDFSSAGTIGQGQIAGAQAKQGALTNLLSTGASVLGSALGGPLGGAIGGGLGGLLKPQLPGSGPFPKIF
jgi:hypothetical protein